MLEIHMLLKHCFPIITLISLQVVYCGPTCQRLHWFTHKRQCKTPVPQRDAQLNRQPKLRELSSSGKEFAYYHITGYLRNA